MTEAELAQVRSEVFAASPRRDSYLHGERHWRAVAHAGLKLAQEVDGCDPLIVLLFALFHDSMRENEDDDPEHGLRGGELARRLLAGRLDDDSLETLFEACRDHSHSPRSDVPTIAVCWDADRLNLWRIGKEPDPTFFSTRPASDPELIRSARGFHDTDHGWDDLTRLALGVGSGPAADGLIDVTAAAGSGEYVEWVIRLTRGQLLDLVLEIEERLRRLVRQALKEARSEWETLIPSSIRANLEQRNDVAAAASRDMLDQADLGQMIGIVLARWKYFGALLGDKQRFTVKTNEFREWRNFLAHGKNPSTSEKFEIAVVVRQVGRQIPVVDEPPSVHPGCALEGFRVLWVDDHPDSTLPERQVFRVLGIEVVPVLSNDEAVRLANQRPFDLVISDIDHGGEEPGDLLPGRLHAVGVDLPVLFYVGAVDPARSPPAGATSITNDRATLVREALNLLSHRSAPPPALG